MERACAREGWSRSFVCERNTRLRRALVPGPGQQLQPRHFALQLSMFGAVRLGLCMLAAQTSSGRPVQGRQRCRADQRPQQRPCRTATGLRLLFSGDQDRADDEASRRGARQSPGRACCSLQQPRARMLAGQRAGHRAGRPGTVGRPRAWVRPGSGGQAGSGGARRSSCVSRLLANLNTSAARPCQMG